MRKKKLRGAIASFVRPDGLTVCDVVQLAEHFAETISNIPETLNSHSACEINILARRFLFLNKEHRRQEIIKRIVEEELNWDFIEKEVDRIIKEEE